MICDERTGDLAQGQWAANEILQAVPGDRDTLTRLERILERADLPAELVRVLDQHTSHAANPDEKLQILHRMADILRGPLQDPAGAAARLEEVVRLDPDDGKALDTLVEIYTALGLSATWRASSTLQVERVVADPAQQAEYLRQLARLVEGPLRRPAAGAQVVGSSWPSCCRPTRRRWTRWRASATTEADWPALVRILERQIPLAEEPGAGRRPGAAARRRSSTRSCTTPTRPREALEQPDRRGRPAQHPIAHDRLRSYYEADEDWPRVVKVAERQLFLTEDPAQRMPAAMAAGRRWSATSWATTRRRSRSSSACWRWTPDNMEALHARRRPVRQDRQLTSGWRSPTRSCWNASPDPDERRVLMLQIAALYENHLDDAARGFEWYRRAYLETPDAEGLQLVDQAAERHGLFEELIQIYEGARARAAEPMEQLAASLKIALICEEKLRDPARAFATLCEALPADPAGRELLPNLERLADQTKDWRGLLDVYARVARARTEVARARRAAAPARRGARAPDGRSVGRARRDAAQLRARSPRTRRRRRRSCAWRAPPGAGKRRSASRATCSRWPRRCPRSWRSRATPPTWSSTRSRIWCARSAPT